jgi:TP901 family phage tail tape measure protein
MAIFIPLVTKFDDKGLQGAQKALANFNNFAVEVGRAAAAAISAVAVVSVREAAQFESSFAKIQGLVGLSTKEIEGLEQAAMKIGPAYGVGANEAAEALFFITSAGLRGADATGVLEAAAKGAAIGLGDMGALANAATAAMNTYGPSVLSGTDAVDALAEAVRLGQFAPEELASSLGRVIPVAAEMGIGLQETLGMIAALTRGGLNASESVTGVRAAMNAFLKPTSEATQLLADYGLKASDVSDSIEKDGFLATMVSLRETFGDNEDGFNRLIGSQEGLNAVLSLTGANLATNTDIISQMTDGVGILDDAFAITSETAEFKFNKGMETVKASLITIGSELLDRLLPYLERFQIFMEENGPQIEQVFDTIFGAVEAVASKIGELSDAVMPGIMKLINDEQFQENVKKLGENFFLIADQVIRFIDSDLGQFLGELTATSIVGGLEVLNDQLERMANLLFVVNESMDVFSGKKPSVDFETLVERAGAAINIRLGELSKYFLDMQAGLTMGRNPSRRAGGGPVSSGNSFLVGEMGPELFTPSSGGGRITPNDALGGNTYNITVNAGMGTNGAALGAQIVSAIKKFERTSGPVFASA